MLHDVEAAVSERPRQELASPCHVFASGDAAKSWGANADDSPLIAANDPEERVTIFMLVVGSWSDGTPGPSMAQ